MWLIAILLIATAMYAPTFASLWRRWMADTQYCIAPVVPFVSGYFVWRKWPEICKTSHVPSQWGLGLIVLGLLVHLMGVVTDVSGGSDISILLTLTGGCIYFFGNAITRMLAFPLAYLAFAIPIPGGLLDLIGFPLQLAGSRLTEHILQLLQIDASRSGVNLSVPGYEFQVALACSGLSSLVALLGVTAVFAYLTRLPVLYKWILFFLALPIALAANTIRITTIALVGYWWGPDTANHIYHHWSSPLLFLAAVCLLLVINRGFEWLSRRPTTSSSS